MDFRDRVVNFVRALPVAHRVGIVAAVLAVAMLGVWFMSWVTTPSYTVLYSGLEESAVSGVIDELETLGVPYQLEGGGTTVLIPQERLYEIRAELAGAGFAGEAVPEGYEILAEQGLTVSDFRQRVDYQRALEGEISKTLMAMDGIDSATVHLVIPEEELFTEESAPVTASVLVGPTRELSPGEVETIAFLTSSSVEGLDLDAITIADTQGTVLHAPGDTGGASVATNRNLRQTREFEQALAGDIGTLLGTVTPGAKPSVVVRATLNFDAQETATETYDPDSQVTLSEQTQLEAFDGTGAVPGGVVGVDGGPLQGEASESQYDRNEVLREYGVNRTTATTVTAPGEVEQLSVAIVMDDGSITGVEVPPNAEIQTLVAAAVGLDEARGDTIAVQKIAFPAPEELEEPVVDGPTMIDRLPQVIAALVLLIVCVALFLMTRRRRRDEEAEIIEEGPVIELPAGDADDRSGMPADQLVGAMAARQSESDLKREVTSLVSNQPDEIAMLLRSWLADRRG